MFPTTFCFYPLFFLVSFNWSFFSCFINHADVSDRRFSAYTHVISNTEAARITKLGIEMFHHESWTLIYFGVKGQGHECRRGLCTFVSAGLFYFYHVCMASYMIISNQWDVLYQ